MLLLSKESSIANMFMCVNLLINRIDDILISELFTFLGDFQRYFCSHDDNQLMVNYWFGLVVWIPGILL